MNDAGPVGHSGEYHPDLANSNAGHTTTQILA